MKIADYSELKNRLSNLKNLSKDSNGCKTEYVTLSEKPAVNFDKVVKKYSQRRHVQSIKSIDALMEINDSKWVFIEFKNGILNDEEIIGVKKKIYDSIFVLSDITSTYFSVLRDNVEFVLVYNREKNLTSKDKAFQKKERLQHHKSLTVIESFFGQYAKQEIICFGIKDFKNYCFNDVHTYSKEEFEDYLQKISQE